MLDDVEHEDLIELGNVDRKFLAIEIPANELHFLLAFSRNQTVHPRDRAPLFHQLGPDIPASAADIQH